MKTSFSIFRVGVLTPLVSAQDAEPLRFAKIISDNMVLQQQEPISLWGWAKPETEVKVTLTQDVQLGEAAGSKIGGPATAEDEGAYSVTVRYVEKNPPNSRRKRSATRARMDLNVKFPVMKASFQPTWIIAETGAKWWSCRMY